MKSLVVALCTALFVFALASMWSDMLRPQLAVMALKSPSQDLANNTERPARRIARSVLDAADEEEPGAPTRSVAKPSRKSSVANRERPVPAEPPDQNAARLREQMADVKDREARLLARQETLQLICDDIHEELARANATRRRADDGPLAVERRVVPTSQREPGGDGLPERGRPASSAAGADVAAKSASEKPAVRGAALMIRQLAQHGSLDTATAYLGRLNEREAAKILTAIHRDDPHLAEQLTTSLAAAREPNLRD